MRAAVRITQLRRVCLRPQLFASRGLATGPEPHAFKADIAASFDKQTYMAHLGAYLGDVELGSVDIAVENAPTLQQQHGFFHGGVTTAIADSAAGYAAMTMFEPGAGVLTTEFKINLIAPAAGDRLVARGRVVKGGKTLSVCKSDVYGVTDSADGSKEVHVATGLFTMMQMQGLEDA